MFAEAKPRAEKIFEKGGSTNVLKMSSWRPYVCFAQGIQKSTHLNAQQTQILIVIEFGECLCKFNDF